MFMGAPGLDETVQLTLAAAGSTPFEFTTISKHERTETSPPDQP
jgi:hypothetical protein